MKVFVIGSSRAYDPADPDQATEAVRNDDGDIVQADKDQIDAAAFAIGAALSSAGHEIWIGTEDDIDVDPHVVEGALSVESPSKIRVQRQHSWPDAYTNNDGVETRWRQFEDWDVTNMEVVREVDGVIALAGRASVVQMGISAWMMNKPVIPIGSFDGGSKILWNYGSARRNDFYQGGLKDAVIDKLAAPWTEESASVVVDALSKVQQARARSELPRKLLLTVLGLTFVSLIGWIFSLVSPIADLADNGTVPFYWLFPTVSLAGLLGANMQTLRAIRNSVRISSRAVPVDIALGVSAGMISAMLYLLVQFGVSGTVNVDMGKDEYVRVALIVSLASLFAALYLDRALARFDTVSDSVIAGKYEG